MADKQQFTLLAQLCADLERSHGEYTLTSAAYGHVLPSGFALLAYLVDSVRASLPEYAATSAIMAECEQYLQHCLCPPEHIVFSEE